MAFRIGDYVTAGELRNSQRNAVFGWLEFAPDFGVRIELTGNMSGELEGKHIRFKLPGRGPHNADQLALVERLADRQIGPVGDMEIRQVRALDKTAEDRLEHEGDPGSEAGTYPTTCLYLEWFSQNGRVVAEIVDPEIEFVGSDGSHDDVGAPADDGEYGLGLTEIRIDEDGVAHTTSFEIDDQEDQDEEDPFGLFDQDLGEQMAESLRMDEPIGEQLEHIPETGEPDAEDLPSTGSENEEQEDTPRPKRPWDEVIPGIDEETKALYEQWDEIFDGKKDEPISYLFKTPMKLPKAEAVTTDEEAEPLVKKILAQLALLSVALDICEHFTPLETYQVLMQDILPNAKVHPNLSASDMVLHFSTSDYCPSCEEEFDAEYDAESGDEDGTDDD